MLRVLVLSCMAHLFIGFQSLVKFIFSLTQAHDVDIFRVEIKADFFSNSCSSCGMDKPFVSVNVIAADLIVHTAEEQGIYANLQFS